MEVLMEILDHIELLDWDHSLKADGNLRSPEELVAHTADLALDTAEFYIACSHFYSMPPTQSVPALISALENLNPQIIESAAVLLSLLHAQDAIGPLIQAFKSKHIPVTDGLMRSLFWFGKNSVPKLYEAFISTESPKVRRDSLATIDLIVSYAAGNNFGSHKLCTGKPLTIEERRHLLAYLSATNLNEQREHLSQRMCSEINVFGSPKTYFLTRLCGYLGDKEIAFLEKQLGKKLVPKADKLPKPKVFRPDFKRNRAKNGSSNGNAPKNPVSVLRPKRKGPTNKT